MRSSENEFFSIPGPSWDVWDFQAFSQTFLELLFSLGNEGKDGKNLNSQTWPGTPRRHSPRHPRPPEKLQLPGAGVWGGVWSVAHRNQRNSWETDFYTPPVLGGAAVHCERCMKILCPKDPEFYAPLALKCKKGSTLQHCV